MLLLLDNYDSFTYNVYQLLKNLGAEVEVIRNDKITIEGIREKKYKGIIISPGPGLPKDAGITEQVIRDLGGTLPILGICLGHQLLALAFGAKTYKMKFGHRGGNQPVKNLKTGKVHISAQNHGYAVDPSSLEGTPLAVTHVNVNDDTIEGLRHTSLPIFSVQYHPEAAPGPDDNMYLFDEFWNLMKGE